MLRAADGDPLPAVGLHGHPRAGDPVVGAGEVPGQPQAERLGGADAVPREREDGVLLRVRRQDVGVVAGRVGGGEVAAQARADIEVDEGVPRGRAVDRDHADLGLSVLVRPEHDRHAAHCCTWNLGRSAPAVGRVGERRQQQRHVVVLGGLLDDEGEHDLRVERVACPARRTTGRSRRPAGACPPRSRPRSAGTGRRGRSRPRPAGPHPRTAGRRSPPRAARPPSPARAWRRSLTLTVSPFSPAASR